MSAPATIGHYRVSSKLGEGGMGAVYRATDSKLNREVAIKVLPPEFAQDAERLARFTREARVLASLNHPNIATIYGVEENALVMELVEGTTIHGPLPLDVALDYAGQIADALEYAHERGVVHRDLKPANVKVTADGVIKVLDFGLAKAIGIETAPDDTSSPTLTFRDATMAGMILGTAAYMSPEQAKGKPVDRRADVWAFGAVLWELITGKVLFAGETVSETIAQVLTHEPDWNQAPARVRRLLRACLQKDLKLRLRSIADWRLLLEDPASPTAPERPRRSLWPIAAAVAAVSLAGAWVWTHRNAPPESASLDLSINPPNGESLFQDAPSGFHAISPDGRNLAFISGANGSRHIWIRPLDSQTARAIPGTELAEGLFWSPDSRHLGFIANNRLLRIDLTTAAIKEICNARTSVRGASWNAEGTVIFGTTATPIQRVSADGGVPASVIASDATKGPNHNYPVFLPDGKRFLYWVRGPQVGMSGVFLASLDGPVDQQQFKQVLAANSAASYFAPPGERTGYLIFHRGTTLFAQAFDPDRRSVTGSERVIAENVAARSAYAEFSISQTGILTASTAGSLFRSLTLMSRKGEILSTIGSPAGYTNLRLSPDNKTAALVHTGTDATLHIYLMDIANGTTVRFTSEGAVNIQPVWSTNGKELLFSSYRDGVFQLFRKPVAGVEQLIPTPPHNARASDWLGRPDRVLYVSREKGRSSHLASGLQSLSLTPGSKPTTLIEPGASSLNGVAVSPSGQWLAYESDDSGTSEIYLRSMPDGGDRLGAPVRISTDGGRNPAWSADGKELFYNSLDDRLIAAKIRINQGRAEREIPVALFSLGGTTAYDGALYWQLIGNGERILVLRSAPVPPKDNMISVRTNWQRALQ